MIEVFILILALVLDISLGEPPTRFHPTVWMGKLTGSLEKFLQGSRFQKLKGIILGLVVLLTFALACYYLQRALQEISWTVYVIASAFVLKTTFAIKSMSQHTEPMSSALNENQLERARTILSGVVRRETEQLDEQKILSATVETIAEGTVDGIAGPLFFYALFGLPGAVAYRAINTLDSMVGYKDGRHREIGWFSAKLDTCVNYFPARLIGLLTVLSSGLLRLNWRESKRILVRDARKTESLNAGFPMAAMAGGLEVALEKLGFYRLGDDHRPLRTEDIKMALRIMKLNTLLFTLLIVLPMISIQKAFFGV